MVTLDDFLAASKKDAGEMEKARHIYRMTEHAFTKNCRQCPSCIRAEDVGGGNFRMRVFCAADKCIKRGESGL